MAGGSSGTRPVQGGVGGQGKLNTFSLHFFARILLDQKHLDFSNMQKVMSKGKLKHVLVRARLIKNILVVAYYFSLAFRIRMGCP